MPAHATHKGRQHWTRWSGTPSDIAEIVTLAKKLTEADDNRAGLLIKVIAPAWESDFVSATDLLDVEAADIQDIETVEAKIYTQTGRRISLTFKQPIEKQPRDAPAPKVVSLNVAGPDRPWVEDATAQMTDAIAAGVPMSAAVERYVFGVGAGVLVLGTILAIVGGDNGRSQGLKVAGIVLLAVGGALVVLATLTSSFIPRLEILPEGAQTRRSKVLRWTRREGAWLTRNVFVILLTIVVTLLVRRLI
jgi:hypothetical protein